mgnify:CR=1 FL=1
MTAISQGTSHRFEALDALRGFAALGVALFHYHGSWAGYLAVDFFLVLSGFVLSYAYSSKNNLNLGDFAVQRLARLYPLHLYTLMAYLLVYLICNQEIPDYPDGSLNTFIQNLFLLQNVGLNPHGLTWNYPSWSISVEFWINMFFFFFVLKSKKPYAWLLISLACFVLMFYRTANLNLHYQNYFTFLNAGLIRGLASFLLGVIAYRLFSRISNHEITRASALEMGILIVMSAAIFLSSVIDARWDFLAAATFSLCVFLFAFQAGAVSKFLGRFQYLGTISYSVYLNQIAVLLLVRAVEGAWGGNGLVSVSLYFTLLIFYSLITYTYIEIPWKSRINFMWKSKSFSSDK